MKDFARAARLLVQPKTNTTDEYLDPTHPQPNTDQGYTDFKVDAHTTTEPVDSPYGDISRWDLLWLGHCGSRFPQASDINAPLGRVVLPNDDTVPEPQYLDMEYGDPGVTVALYERLSGDPQLAAHLYSTEVDTRANHVSRSGLLEREANPRVVISWLEAILALVEDGWERHEAFRRAAETTLIPFCVPRNDFGRLEPAALEDLRRVLNEQALKLV